MSWNDESITSIWDYRDAILKQVKIVDLLKEYKVSLEARES